MQPLRQMTPDARWLAGLAAAQSRTRRAPRAAQSALSTNPLGGNPTETLVFVFLRGGMDGLSLCVPHADPDYAALRPTQAIPSPGQAGGALPLDGLFGLHPSATGLHSLYQAGQLALVHNVGSPDPSRSHFDAMKFIESAYILQAPPAGGHNSGWLGRHLAQGTSSASIRGIVLEPTITLTAAGGPKTLPMPDPADFDFSGHSSTMGARRSLYQLLYSRALPALAGPAIDTLSAIDTIGAIDFDNYQPAGGAVYPAGSYFAFRLERAAALIKANIGIEMLEVDLGGWDDHTDMGAPSGQFSDRVAQLSDSLTAFAQDLGSAMDRVTVVVMSEFGRRAPENGSQGTDHGRAGVMLLLGNQVNGGQVVHDWQGLTPADLDDDNVPVRIDYRDVLAEVLTDRMGATNLASIFPGFSPTNYNLVS